MENTIIKELIDEKKILEGELKTILQNQHRTTSLHEEKLQELSVENEQLRAMISKGTKLNVEELEEIREDLSALTRNAQSSILNSLIKYVVGCS